MAVQWQKVKITFLWNKRTKLFPRPFGYIVIVVRHAVADIAAAGVHHYPDVLVIALLDFYEMVASAKCADLLQSRLLFLLSNFARLQFRHKFFVLSFFIMRKADRDSFADTAQDFL